MLSLSGVLGVLVIAAALNRAVLTDAKDYRVPSEAMVPTVQVGDRVTLNHGAYDDGAPEIGDIVIHHPPLRAEDGTVCGEVRRMCDQVPEERADVTFVERVVAGPGDRIALRDGHVVLDGEVADEPFIADCGGAEGCNFPRPITVPEGHYFMLGDNRGSSDDSRFWGPVPLEWILGRVEKCDVARISCSPLR